MERKGIIFDMDNTLVQSRINFRAMRHDLVSFLVREKYDSYDSLAQFQTPAEVIEHARFLREKYCLTDVEENLWDIVLQHEKKGMEQVKLEDGVYEVLRQLYDLNVLLTIVTNNAYSSALHALERTRIRTFFSLIVGREQMEALKPSPAGVLLVKKRFDTVNEWLMIGDSWIDGYAAQQSDVPFVAYQAKAETMERNDVHPVIYANRYDELNEWLTSHWIKK